jgi:hypothetical protein
LIWSKKRFSFAEVLKKHGKALDRKRFWWYFIRCSRCIDLFEDGIPIITVRKESIHQRTKTGTAFTSESAKYGGIRRKSLMREELFIKVKRNYENLFG